MFTHATPFNPVDDNRIHPFDRGHGSLFSNTGSRGSLVFLTLVLFAPDAKLTSGLDVRLMDYFYFICFCIVVCSLLNAMFYMLFNYDVSLCPRPGLEDWKLRNEGQGVRSSCST